jgi:hypothetical protein
VTLKSLLRTLVYLICLFVVTFLGANLLVGGNDMKDMVDLARSKCIEKGFQAKDMSATCMIADTGTLGFGGRGTVEFSPVGMDPKRPKPLRVELRKPLNLTGWEVDSIVEVTDN